MQISLTNIIKKSFFYLFVLLLGCSGLEMSEREKLRQKNAEGEYVYRRSDEFVYEVKPPRKQPRDPYPWELR